jgi:hypothetical protein
MTYDAYEWTTRDPLEDTVPDPIRREPRLSTGQRRALEASVVLVLAPALLATEWLDDAHHSKASQTNERVTVVHRGGTGTLAHVRLRLLGRDATAPARKSTTPAGAVRLSLVMELRPLDAQGVKASDYFAYSVRDRAGHVWSAYASVNSDLHPTAGVAFQRMIYADLPPSVVNSVVLEARGGGLTLKTKQPAQVLRFAH